MCGTLITLICCSVSVIHLNPNEHETQGENWKDIKRRRSRSEPWPINEFIIWSCGALMTYIQLNTKVTVISDCFPTLFTPVPVRTGRVMAQRNSPGFCHGTLDPVLIEDFHGNHPDRPSRNVRRRSWGGESCQDFETVLPDLSMWSPQCTRLLVTCQSPSCVTDWWLCLPVSY